MPPRALALTGYGINCEEETAFALQNSLALGNAGVPTDIVHVNDLIDRRVKLDQYQILVFPGGFSYGDHTGSGNALANKIRNHLWEDVRRFVERDTLTLGICNGFQVLVNLGLLPATDGTYGKREVALVHNDSARYINRWIDVDFKNDEKGDSPWTTGIRRMSLPIAHGEGKLYTDSETMETIIRKNLIAAKYVQGPASKLYNLPANPNGSLENIAALQDPTGRILGMMPHPERAIRFTQLPWWPLVKQQYLRAGSKLPTEGPGMKIFRNAAAYFK